MWLWELKLRRRRKNRPAIRFAQDVNYINDPSAIRVISCKDASKAACREEAGPASVPQGCRGTRHRFAACGLDRLSLLRRGLAKRSRLTMSGTAPLSTGTTGIAPGRSLPPAARSVGLTDSLRGKAAGCLRDVFRGKNRQQMAFAVLYWTGGEGGIRTPDRLAPMPH